MKLLQNLLPHKRFVMRSIIVRFLSPAILLLIGSLGSASEVNTIAVAPSLENVITVSSSGGEFSSIQAALASITDANTGNWYRIQVGPGIYHGRVFLKSFVRVVGSGRDVTIIRTGGSTSVNVATVTAVSNSALESLTVENTGGDANAVAVYGTGTPSMRDLSLHVSGGSLINRGFHDSGMAKLENISITVDTMANSSGEGIYNQVSTIDLDQITITLTGHGQITGIELRSTAAVTLSGCTITASSTADSAAVNNAAGGTLVLDCCRFQTDSSTLSSGVINDGARLDLLHTEISSSGVFAMALDVYGAASTISITHSQIVSSSIAISNRSSSSLVIRESALVGPLLIDNTAGGSLICLQSSTATTELDTNCVPIL